MENYFNIELENNVLSEYDNMLSAFNNWISFKREIKLNAILYNDKKVQLDIDNIKLYIFFRGKREFSYKITNIRFVIKNLKILEIKVKLDRKPEKDLKIFQHLKDGSVTHFFI